MEFKFTIQPYQTRAAEAVCDVFTGQPKSDVQLYVRDVGTQRMDRRGQMSMIMDDGAGYRNAPVALPDDELLANIRARQRKNRVSVSQELSHDLGAVELDVEMETGTGKTYVYTQTIFELNERYGWSKFVIVVPSVAIREGVAKSLQTTEKHFFERYGKRIWWFVYNSSRLNEIDGFASRADISVMIVNIQAFNAFDKSKSGEGRGGDKAARIMFSERDEFGSRRPIDVLAATHPILIIDEPQKMGTKAGATRKGMKQFEPLFSLNYSATHRERHNAVFELDSLDAYNERLVKRIEVKGIEMKGMRGTDGYLYLQDIQVSPSRPPRALMEFKQLLKSGRVGKRTRLFDEGDDIYVASGELEAYRDGFRILRIVPDQAGQLGYVELLNHDRIYRGQVMNDSSEEDLRRIQIRETIASHFEKEEALFRRGIKCLSLFFIDEVAKYRVYNDDGAEGVGEYGRIFEEEYAAAVSARCAESTPGDASDLRYLAYLQRFDAHEVHRGYFSIDKRGHAVDSRVGRGAEFSDDESAYDLILKNKERLLSFDEPCRFIFSHSALREGWDNPNVFQICTLRSSGGSDISRRQEVGRGLRLCVNQDGVRQDEAVLGKDAVQRVNLLTVIANESYGSFVDALQSDIRNELRERPRSVTEALFCGLTLDDGNVMYTLTEDDAKDIVYALQTNRLIDRNGMPTEKLAQEGLEGVSDSDLPEHLDGFLDQIATIALGIGNNQLNGMVSNALSTKVPRNELNGNYRRREFQALWSRINHKHAYTVSFDSEELRQKAIEHIDRELTVSRPRYRLVRGEQRDKATREQIESGSQFSIDRQEDRLVQTEGAAGVTYDLVGEVARRAMVTRESAMRILANIDSKKFAMFRINPEEFIVHVGDAIMEEKARMIVDHIRYNRIDGEYDSDIFTEEMPENLSRALHASKNIQDWVFWDSVTERRFAEDLDHAEEVCVFARLPRSFQIPTPVGGYAPDWAIAFNEGKVKHIFFVAETKGSLRSLSLKGVESAKIACARKLFEQLGEHDVAYDFVSTYDELLDKVMR